MEIERATTCLNILMIGDLVGASGRHLLRDHLSVIKERYQIDICIANGENAAAGLGLSVPLAQEIFDYGVDAITMGNHTWSKRDLLTGIEDLPALIRPANGPDSWPGRGHVLVRHQKGNVLVINLLGRVFMDALSDPFQTIGPLLDDLKKKYQTKLIVIDFHAEATSEKMAMGWFLDGRVTLVAGTHTHVQTSDERMLENGTAYITDVGMTGPVDGIIGMDRQSSLRRFVDRLPAPYEAARGRARLQAVVVEAEAVSGQARSIRRINWPHSVQTGD